MVMKMEDDEDFDYNYSYLIANMDIVEGHLELSKEIQELDGLTKADILGDWAGLLQKEYEKAIDQMNAEGRELARKNKNG